MLEIDTQGAQKVKNRLPESILIFIVPPTIKDLEQRLANRQTEKGSDIKHRLDKAKVELSEIDYYDYVVVNKDIDKAIQSVVDIIDNNCKEN